MENKESLWRVEKTWLEPLIDNIPSTCLRKKFLEEYVAGPVPTEEVRNQLIKTINWTGLGDTEYYNYLSKPSSILFEFMDDRSLLRSIDRLPSLEVCDQRYEEWKQYVHLDIGQGVLQKIQERREELTAPWEWFFEEGVLTYSPLRKDSFEIGDTCYNTRVQSYDLPREGYYTFNDNQGFIEQLGIILEPTPDHLSCTVTLKNLGWSEIFERTFGDNNIKFGKGTTLERLDMPNGNVGESDPKWLLENNSLLRCGDFVYQYVDDKFDLLKKYLKLSLKTSPDGRFAIVYTSRWYCADVWMKTDDGKISYLYSLKRCTYRTAGREMIVEFLTRRSDGKMFLMFHKEHGQLAFLDPRTGSTIHSTANDDRFFNSITILDDERMEIDFWYWGLASDESEIENYQRHLETPSLQLSNFGDEDDE
jgi:hypothetical protein